jgi:NAD(P)-dependent dehydrogenase (short-subunit alcohol dehydrogenase family)
MGFGAPARVRMTEPLAGRTAIVSGAGRGIGAAIAGALDAAGARVALIARTESELTATAATLTNDPVVIVADLGTADGPSSAAAAAIDAFGGRVDVLVNNAAKAIRKPSDELTVDEIDTMLDVNVRSVLLLTVAVLPAMIAAKSGSIISLSSVSAVRGTPRRAAYAATKAAIDGMTRALAMEYGPIGIRANAVAPGVVHTAMWRELLAIDGVAESVTSVIPTRRLTEPGEIADVVTFLASDASRAITGETLSADGGMHATLNLYPTV